MQDFRKLRVWQAARELTMFAYQATRDFPGAERFGLVAQMRTAVISIGANIAEGAGRASKKDSKRFLQMAYGSACELFSHCAIATDLGYLSLEQMEEADRLIGAVRRMLGGLMARLK